MWKFIERAMAVIGFIATVFGTAIAYYAFVEPADLSADLARVAKRLSREPSLEENERLYVDKVLSIGPAYLVHIEKQPTNAGGTVDLRVCDTKSAAALGEGTFSFGREAADFSPQVRKGPDAITLVLSAKLGKNTFSRKEEWRNVNATWARVSEPQIAAGPQSCG